MFRSRDHGRKAGRGYGLDTCFKIGIVRAHRDLACARIDHRFERCVRDECIDESAVERLGRAPQRVQLDRICRLGFSIVSTVCGRMPIRAPSCAPVMPIASRNARTQPFGGAFERSVGLSPSSLSSSRSRALLRASLFTLPCLSVPHQAIA